MGGGGKGGSKQKIYDFYMSLDYGICHGPIDQINEVVIKDKSAAVGPIAADGTVSMNKKKLFGGDDGEGGPVGMVEYYLGGYAQKMSAELAARFGLTPDTAPGYRGLAHVFFRGGSATAGTESGSLTAEGNPLFIFGLLFNLLTSAGSSNKGFRWTSNNPYMPATKIHVTRGSVGLASDKYVWPIIGTDENGDYIIAAPGDAFTDGKLDRSKLPDANPAGVIYEALTNADWGKGELASAIDIASFEAAAAVLHAEHFGVSLKWMREDSVENFIAEVLDHIKGVLFEHPATGKWTLTLIRGGYSTGGIPHLTPMNCDVSNIKTRLWGETINQITVAYTDPVSEEQETISADNPANIAIQGGVKAEERDYHGIRNPWLAQFVAERDVAESSRTLTSATVLVDRRAFEILPGSVLRFTWPEEDIDGMICRVMKIDYGNSSDRQVKLDIVEDIFATPVPAVRRTPELPQFATVPQAQPLDRLIVMGAPLPALIAAGEDADAIDAEYPVTTVMFLGADANYTPLDIEAHGDRVLSNGSTQLGALTTFLPTPNMQLGVALAAEVRSVIPGTVIEDTGESELEPGQLFLIGSTEADHELVMLDTYDDGADEWTVIRGVWDTVPQAWPSTARIWRFEESTENVDPRGPTAGSAETYYFLPRTDAGQLTIASAPAVVYTPSARPHLPFRPANCSINGNGFGHTAFVTLPYPASFTVTWQNRNRLTEDSVAMTWNGGEVAPETGQTTTLRFRDADTGTLEYELTGLTGNSVVVESINLVDFSNYAVEFVAVRDGLESYRAPVRTLEFKRFGWGNNFGNDFNENNGA